MGRSKDTIEDLNKLLRDELSATETYRHALDNLRDEFGQDPRFSQLTQMLHDHEQAATQLRALIRQMGGEASNDSGAWGTWSNTVMGAARLLGDKSALKALKEGEQSGLKDYRKVQERTTADLREVFAAMIAKEQEHVRQLDRLIDAA
jgi:rubrerythrin